MHSGSDEVERQRSYFTNVALEYDGRIEHEFEHTLALSFLSGAIQQFSCQSVLDIGSGTGRALTYLRSRHPDLRLLGIEPVEALRNVGHSKGISQEELVDGDATILPFDEDAFDIVCAFGALHHVPRPNIVVDEMIRVGRRALFISDSNNFGQGPAVNRIVKQMADTVRIWPALNFLKTLGKGYTFSEGDGVAYSYSVFNSYRQIGDHCTSVHVVNTSPLTWGVNPYRRAAHVALLGLLK